MGSEGFIVYVQEPHDGADVLQRFLLRRNDEARLVIAGFRARTGCRDFSCVEMTKLDLVVAGFRARTACRDLSCVEMTKLDLEGGIEKCDERYKRGRD